MLVSACGLVSGLDNLDVDAAATAILDAANELNVADAGADAPPSVTDAAADALPRSRWGRPVDSLWSAHVHERKALLRLAHRPHHAVFVLLESVRRRIGHARLR